MKRSFPFVQQRDMMDCGPTCLYMICRYYGKRPDLEKLRMLSETGKEGVNLLGINNAAEKIGFKTHGASLTLRQIDTQALLPCILHWGHKHFVVLYKKAGNQYKIADPSAGLVTVSKKELLQHWATDTVNEEQCGITLLLEPTNAFFAQQDSKEKKIGWGMLLSHFAKQKRYIIQLFSGLLAGSLLQLIFPFLTQSIVDVGINQHDLSFIYIILIAQFMLFFSRTVVDFIRSRILLFLSTKINLSILSDFWVKLMKLPLSYFDTKKTGDILQRIGDHKRIENFLTGSALNTFFSLFNLVIFSIVLLRYNTTVFLIFAAGSILYILWIRLFLRYRKKLDYQQFSVAAKENTATMQLIYGMQEIKLNNAEKLRRWEWESLQSSLFNYRFKSLSINQYQQAGAFFINEGKNILITFIVAKAVLNGQLTLGAMLAIQYITGQLSSPIEQLVGFVQQAQDAKISIDRLNEIHGLPDEEPADKILLNELPKARTINLQDVSFTYAGAGNLPVLKHISLSIPEGKVTAIVGMSGSGKTTLLKLLLKFYDNYSGEISIGDSRTPGGTATLKNIGAGFWRSQCGSVLQEGYIFNDSIAKNIAVSEQVPDMNSLVHACRVANILPFIEGLPLTFNTKIGVEGNGLSSGQKQRLQIARAVYKDPEYLFFDEATNSLDADNESIIMRNLQQFFENKTVVIVAHRLSTVKNADNIIVLKEGSICEMGNHQELTQKRGAYYELVRNQLELGN